MHYFIRYVVVHQRYQDATGYYDIALVQTTAPLVIAWIHQLPYINFKPLPKNYEAYMYGRGKPGGEAYIQYPAYVRYIKIRDDSRDCELQPEYRNTDLILCYHLIAIEDGARGQIASTFGGDSGSPILANDLTDGNKYLIGLHTRRNPLSALHGENVRAGINVASFIEWIHYVVNKDYTETEIRNNGKKLRCCDPETEEKIKWHYPLNHRPFLHITKYS